MKISLLLLVGLISGCLLGAPVRAAEQDAGEDLYLLALQSINDGRFGEAGRILERMIAQQPRNAGEWLDVAMLHCALGHHAEAEALFIDIDTRLAPPAGIRDFIAQQRQQGCTGPQRKRQWSLSAARGTDSNVNQGTSNPLFNLGNGGELELQPQYLPHRDHYSTVAGDYFSELNNDGDVGYLQFLLRHQDHLSEYNTASLFAGAEHAWYPGRWSVTLGASGGLMTLGGQLYQQQAQLQLRALVPAGLPPGMDWQLIGNLTRINYRTLSNFNATSAEVRSALAYHDSQRWGQLSLGYLNDRGNGARPGGDRVGWSLRALGHAALGDKLQGELDWSRLRWQSQRDYLPGLIDVARRQNTQSLRATLIYPLTPAHSVHLEWRQTHNQENISLFQYSSRQLQVSWHWNGD